MLREIAGMTEDKDTHIQDLEDKKRVFDSHGQIINPKSNKALFTAKALKLYSDSDVKNQDQINKLFSFEDLLALPPSDLIKKVFVSWLIPTCLTLDDDLVAKTAFFQIEVLQTVLNMKNYVIITIADVSTSVRF